MPHSFTLIVFLCENELFQRGWGGDHQFPAKIENPGGGGGVLSEIPSVVGVWIFSGTTHCDFQCLILPSKRKKMRQEK